MVLAFLRILLGFTVWGSDCKGLTGSGVTVCTGLAGLINCCFSAIILLSHIKDTSSILCRTYESYFGSRRALMKSKYVSEIRTCVMSALVSGITESWKIHRGWWNSSAASISCCSSWSAWSGGVMLFCDANNSIPRVHQVLAWSIINKILTN